MSHEDIFWELHSGLPRQGPGSAATTMALLELCRPLPEPVRALDIAAGPGAASLVLASEIGAAVTAVDTHRPFLDQLEERAERRGLRSTIRTLAAPMEALPFENGSFELVWCEAAAYIMGVDAALDAWRRLLAPGGALVVTECEWRTEEPSPQARVFWQAYPGMRTGEDNRRAIAEAGYELLGTVELPESDWWDEYYTPLSERIDALVQGDDPDAAELAPMLREEILLRRDHGDDYGYTGYAMRPLP